MSDLALHSTFAGCRIEAVAGRGGMGVVYRATQVPLGRSVALKVVERERAADDSFHARFEREMRVTAAIDHPNVIPVYEAGEADGRLYLVMRWVQGGDLQQLIHDRGALAAPRAVDIVAQVGFALEAAHHAGLVHRDVKPANVLIAANGGSEHVYLSDFGLTLEVSSSTRITESGDWIGTVDFMAPEQFEGRSVDARTDVYALGCVLYATLTGKAPFPRDTVAATMLAHLRDPPPRPSAMRGVSPAFDSVVARALAKEPADRYGSARELVEAAIGAGRQTAIGAGSQTAIGAGGKAAVPARSEAAVAAGREAALAAGTDTPVATGSETGVLPRTSAAQEPPPAEPDRVPLQPTARLERPRRRFASRAYLAGFAVLAVAGIAAVLAAVGSLGADEATGPLSIQEVRATVNAFARAYGREDRRALAGVLSRDVSRVTFGDRQRGRSAVLREYGKQFAANTTEDYVLSDLQVRPGPLGRASARYEAPRSGGKPITGRIVFGVRREGGKPRIGLIALEPDS